MQGNREQGIDSLFFELAGSFGECEMVNGVMAILQRWKYIFLNSNEYIKEIISEVPIDLIENT
jgi:hypothetical protein